MSQQTPLSEEYTYYDGIRDTLVKENEGKYALIKGKKLAGIFETDSDAYETGIMKFGNVAFLIIKISKVDEDFWIPSLDFRLFKANIK